MKNNIQRISFLFVLIFFSITNLVTGANLKDVPFLNNQLLTSDTEFVQYGIPFKGVPDRRDVIIYQVNMRCFSPNSNFKSVIARLDSIKALGANVIYLMPIFPVGIIKTSNSPYCIKDYKAINTEFGTLADLRSLVDEAHKRNMCVILDWVANHTAWDNEWIYTHKDWYLQDAANNIISPPGKGWNDVAQLNYNSSALRLEMIKDMKYWVYAANIDGFRCDYSDGPPVEFWKQAIDTLRNISTTHNLLFLAEGTRASNYSAGFDYNFGFNFFGQLKNIYKNNPVSIIDSLNISENKNATDGRQVVRYTTNHDVNGSDGTPMDLFGGKKGSMAAFVIVAYMNSVPMIYNGQEVGTPYKITFPFTSQKIDWSINADITAEYKSILAFRNSSNAIRRGKLISYSNADICAFIKEIDSEKVFVISNLRDSTIHYKLPIGLSNSKWKDVMKGGIATTLNDEIILQPYQYIILTRLGN